MFVVQLLFTLCMALIFTLIFTVGFRRRGLWLRPNKGECVLIWVPIGTLRMGVSRRMNRMNRRSYYVYRESN